MLDLSEKVCANPVCDFKTITISSGACIDDNGRYWCSPECAYSACERDKVGYHRIGEQEPTILPSPANRPGNRD